MEFSQHRGKYGDLKNNYVNCLIFCMQTEPDVLWTRLCCAILFVCCSLTLRAGVSVSLLMVSMSELCFLEQTASWHTGSCHWENISVEGHLSLLSSGNLNDFSALNSCGIWEHLTPPEEHPAPWRIKPGILTWIHTNHFQSVSWLMITEVANNPYWLQKDKLTWHLVTSLQLPVTSQLYSLSLWFRKHLLSS